MAVMTPAATGVSMFAPEAGMPMRNISLLDEMKTFSEGMPL